MQSQRPKGGERTSSRYLDPRARRILSAHQGHGIHFPMGRVNPLSTQQKTSARVGYEINEQRASCQGNWYVIRMKDSCEGSPIELTQSVNCCSCSCSSCLCIVVDFEHSIRMNVSVLLYTSSRSPERLTAATNLGIGVGSPHGCATPRFAFLRIAYSIERRFSTQQWMGSSCPSVSSRAWKFERCV